MSIVDDPILRSRSAARYRPFGLIFRLLVEKLHDGFRPRLNVQLSINFVQVPVHGARADAELIGDLLVRQARMALSLGRFRGF
jgi:hypothetical protein